MHPNEKIVYEWLLKQGYKKEQIYYGRNLPIDFKVVTENEIKFFEVKQASVGPLYEYEMQDDGTIKKKWKKLKVIFSKEQYELCQKIKPTIIVISFFKPKTILSILPFDELEEYYSIYINPVHTTRIYALLKNRKIIFPDSFYEKIAKEKEGYLCLKIIDYKKIK